MTLSPSPATGLVGRDNFPHRHLLGIANLAPHEIRFLLDEAEIWEGDESALGFFKMLTGAKIEGGEVGRHVETAL